MFVNKIGQHHLEIGENCQDFGSYIDYPDNLYSCHKLVCDGCSEGLHTEVGAKLYTHLYDNIGLASITFDKIVDLIGNDPSTIRDYLCFTILDLWKFKNNDFTSFLINYCGDGYIILHHQNDEIEFVKLDDGEYPKYFAYNYIEDKSRMTHYQDGVNFTHLEYSDQEYKNVGIASDGIRYIVNCGNEDLKNEFTNILKEDKEVKMKRFINKHQSLFKDDITISF